MSVRQSLREIDEAVDDVFDRHRKYQERKTGESRRNVYEKALREVQDVAGRPEMEALREWIEATIREEERLPTGREVRKRGAKICREAGHEVSTGSWLGA